ncbi:MAG: hypothetical protein WD471_00370, partial [Candidatus Paceibacterota bacterium]
GLFWAGHLMGLFESILWYDKLLHFIGGMWIGLIIIWVYKKYKEKIPFYQEFKIKPLKMLVILILVVGIGWEVFEFALVQYSLYAHGVAPNLQPSRLDILGDIITNTLGTITGYFITRK